MADQRPGELGANLRELRATQGLSLRQLERDSGINNAYLSQLERGDVTQPTPSMLARLAEAYGVPIQTLMGWAGYATSSEALTPPQAKALNYFGDASDEEIEALRAILTALRAQGPTFSAPHHTDRLLTVEERQVIRDYSMALLHEAGAVGTFPTPLDDLMSVAKLVYAGEITLSLGERRSLARRFGDKFERAMRHLQGMISFEQNAVWLAADLYPSKKRFVHAHELGHHILPVHRQLAYLDNWETMDGSLRDACEREANQAAIDLLAQGDRLREIADDSRLGLSLLQKLSLETEISLVATARYICEESRRPRCAVISYRARSTRQLMPRHLYPSVDFERRFRWKDGRTPDFDLAESLRIAASSGETIPLRVNDVRGRTVELRCEALDTPYARIGLLRKPAAKPVATVLPGLR